MYVHLNRWARAGIIFTSSYAHHGFFENYYLTDNKKKKKTQKYRTAEEKECSLVQIKSDQETWYDFELNLLQLILLCRFC